MSYKKINKKNRVGFDQIAPIYDAITSIVSFNRINKSQLAFLSHLSTQTTCLILGGGTGYFLQKLVEENKTIRVTYVDASASMIELAQQRIKKNNPGALNRIAFSCERVEDFEFDTYDVIVCNYFLDLFDELYLSTLLQRFKQHLNKEALLYITDFSIPEKGFMHWSTKTGLKILYRFFGCVASLSTQHLSDIESIVLQNKFVLLESSTFFNGVLKCSLYKLSDSNFF